MAVVPKVGLKGLLKTTVNSGFCAAFRINDKEQGAKKRFMRRFAYYPQLRTLSQTLRADEANQQQKESKMILAIEVSSKMALLASIDGTPPDLIVIRPKEKFGIPDQDESIARYVDLQKNFEMYLQNQTPELVVLCEGGSDSQKSRIRMGFAILAACHNTHIPSKTYPTNSASKYINSGFEKDFKFSFDDFFGKLGLPQTYKRLMSSAIRHMK